MAQVKIHDTPNYFRVTDAYGQTDIIIGLPLCPRPVSKYWADAIGQLQYPNGFSHGFLTTQSKNYNASSIGVFKNDIVARALKLNAQYIFFIDDDTEPPKQAIVQLLDVMQGDPLIGICGGLYVRRSEPFTPLIWMDNQGQQSIDEWNEPIFECAAVGGGCMLINTAVFLQSPSPFFGLERDDDIFLCRAVRNAGYKVFVDTDVRCRHWDALRNKAYIYKGKTE